MIQTITYFGTNELMKKTGKRSDATKDLTGRKYSQTKKLCTVDTELNTCHSILLRCISLTCFVC
jgi:hypothetical protein